MTTYHVDDIRNIALVGHGAVGKTSLADSLLFKAGAVERHGSVDDGTSLSDFDDEEKKRHFSIDTSVLHAEVKGKQLHLLDAPGYPDFVGAALEALNAVETAVIVLAANHGIEVNTRRMFAEAGRRNLARMIVVNKMDADNIHGDELLPQLRSTFGKACVAFNAPIGVGAGFSGVIDLLAAGGKQPAGCPFDVAAERSRLVDAIVEADDDLTEKYLQEGDVSADELAAAVPKALAAGTVIPVFFSAAKKDVGVPELVDAFARFAPSPVQGSRRRARVGVNGGARELALEPKEEGEVVGQVFKTLTDKFVGHLSFFRIFSGKLKADQPIVNARTGKATRAGGLLLVQGKSQQPVTEAIAGDIVAVAKIDDLGIGDTVSTSAHPPVLPTPQFPTPMFGLAIEPKARGDEQKISGSLHKLTDEDPTFKVTRDPQTKEMVITGMSQLHLDVVQQRLKRRFDLDVITHEPKIPYRETITSKASGAHKHKKQSGGRGQFGEVHLRVYPLTRDIHSQEDLLAKFANKDHFEKLRSAHYDPEHNFAFLDTIVGGTIPNQFVPAIEKGCKELLERGALAGYRIQDIAVEVYEGKDHPVDSSEAAFKTAGRIAFRNAILQAHPALLEPIVTLEVTAPSKYTGAILGDLNGKRARVENQDSLAGDLALIQAKVPLAEVTRYAAQLGSMTQGQGSYTMDFSHYDTVPANVQQQIVAKSKVAADEDE
jgi:elongation factor G